MHKTTNIVLKKTCLFLILAVVFTAIPIDAQSSSHAKKGENKSQSSTTQPATLPATKQNKPKSIMRERLPAQPLPLHVAYIGDSLTAQKHYPNACGLKLMQSKWVKSFKESRFAFGGATAKDVLQKFEKKEWALKPDKKYVNYAVIMLGTNAYNYDDLLKVIAYAHKQGFNVLVLTTPPRLQKPEKKYGPVQANYAYNNKLRENIKEGWHDGKLSLFLDIVSLLLDPNKSVKPKMSKQQSQQYAKSEWLNPKYAKDHTHLNVDGYVILGQAVADKIINSLHP